MKLEGIIFILSIIVLDIAFIFVKKVEKKINILSTIGVTIAVNMCLNGFLCYVLTFFNIKNSMYILAILNIIIASIVSIDIFKKMKNKEKCLQLYFINKIDAFCVAVILFITILSTNVNFGFPFNIKYDSGDSATHYYTSVKFMENEELLTDYKGDVYGGFETRKFMSYVNSGLIMKLFEGKINIIDNYIIFISFGIFVLFLTGYLLYFVLVRFSKNDKTRLIALLISVLCILGYPLNSLLFGFEYMSLSFIFILAIIEVIYLFSKDGLGLRFTVSILFLLNFGLFCSYYMFVPFVYTSEWIYLCIYSYKKDRNIFRKNNIILLTVGLLLPFILGYIYHLAPDIYKIFINCNSTINDIQKGNVLDTSDYILNRGFKVDGYIYKNFYSNFILLVPMALYIIARKFKENKFMSLLCILNILYIIVLLIGNKFDKVSDYYLSKNYFTLWIIMFILNYKALMYIYDKKKYVAAFIPIIYGVIMVICMCKTSLGIGNSEDSSSENILKVMDIYTFNTDFMINIPTDFTKEQIDFIKYIRKEINLEDNYLFVGEPEQIYWWYSFTEELKENDVTKKYGGYNKFNYVFWEYKNLINSSEYIIYLNNTLAYEIHKQLIWDNAEEIFSNSIGGVVKKIN